MRISGAVCAILLAGCADYTNEPDPTFGLPDSLVVSPSLQRDVQPILTKRCSIGGCHSLATQQAELALAAGASHAELVGRPATLRIGATLVIPGDADNSWLMAMLDADPTRRGGLSGMPLASTPLTSNQLRTIANWINRGAPND